jgi:signal transduction histidine kinase
MATEFRKSGISVVGDVPWGTHFCHFYETKQDLLDTLIPYFKAGLESKEFCLWVVSDIQLITVEEAKGALAQAVPDLERHISDENIEILNGHDWYFEQHALNLARAKHGWDAKLKRALARGYEGLRASADTFWLAEKDWKDFFAYEKQVNDWITNQSMTVMCTYPLAKSGATEVLDVVQSHQFAIARRQGKWEVIETPDLIQAKAKIKRLNEELEQRVVDRTSELLMANEQLRSLSARLQSAREQEGIRIARELHDELGATLSSLRWDLEEVVEVMSDSTDLSQFDDLRKKLEAMITLTDTTVNVVRGIASELRPPALDELGLSEAIEWQARQFQGRTGIIVECDCDQESLDLNEEQSTEVFRIFQEALTNILRHAQATTVHLQLHKENGEFILRISDNGRGITDDEKSGQRTLGLLGMRERAHLIGGEVSITSAEGGGTVVMVRVPIADREKVRRTTR